MQNKEFIPVNIPLLDGKEREYINNAISTGWISSEGPYVQEFEEKLAKRVGRKYGIAVSSGTAALDVAVAALNLSYGDEVILPSHTIISCASAIVKAGAKPVLVDSDPMTWNMRVADVEKRINKNTKAIMVVHIFSLPVDMDPILELARKYDLKVIEDAAQMIGQTYKTRQCGSFGDISTFSFYPNKHITTGEGGMILTDSNELASRCKSLRNLCFQKKRFVHEEIGWNYRLTNLQAALGLAQLEKIDEHIKIKKRMGAAYKAALGNIEMLDLPPEDQSYAENIYWVFGLIIKDDATIDAEFFMNRLAEKNIGTRPFFWPMHMQPVFLNMGIFQGEKYPFAERMGRNGFYLPSGLGMSDSQQEMVIESVRRTAKEVR